MSLIQTSTLVTQDQYRQVQAQEQQVIPPPLARLMAIAETSVVGVFDQIALLAARLEAAERQNREMAVMYGAQLSANAQAIATLSEQVKVLGTLKAELAETRQENAALKQSNAQVRQQLDGFCHHLIEERRLGIASPDALWTHEYMVHCTQVQRLIRECVRNPRDVQVFREPGMQF